MDTGDIETLSVKFHFVEESLAEIKSANQRLLQETQETQDKIKEVFGQTNVDLKAMADDYAKHKMELSGKETENELKHRKELLESFKRQILASTEDLGQKQDLLKPVNQELDSLIDRLQTVKGHFSDLKQIAGEAAQHMGVSTTSLAEIGSIGGLIALAFTSLGEIRRYERPLAEAGAGKGRVLGQGELEDAGKYAMRLAGPGGMDMSEQEAQGLTSGLLGIRGVNAGDISRVVGGGPHGRDTWGERVAKMGESIGEGPAGAVGMVKTMMEHLNIPMQGVEKEFDKLRQKSAELGDAHHEYMDAVLATADSMKIYGVTLMSTSSVMGMFWDKIQNKEVSMDQVTSLLKLGTMENMGQLGYGGAMAAQSGSVGLKRALAGKGITEQIDIAQRILEGSYTANGQSGEQNQKEMMEFYGQQALSAGGAEHDRIKENMMLKTMTGLDYFKSMPADQQQGFIERMAAGAPTAADQAAMSKAGKGNSIDQIAESLSHIHDPIQEIIKILKDIARLIGGLGVEIAGFALNSPHLKKEGTAMMAASIGDFGDLLSDAGVDVQDIMKEMGRSQVTTLHPVHNKKLTDMLNKQADEDVRRGQSLSPYSGQAGAVEIVVQNITYVRDVHGNWNKAVTELVDTHITKKNKTSAPLGGVKP